MPNNSRSFQSMPIGTLLLLGLACVIDVTLLVTATAPSQGGEAAFGEGIQALFLTFGLWVVLAILLLVGGVMGRMPRWAAVAWLFLIPLAGVADFVAIDMCSRRIMGAIVFPFLLPVLVALYAMWARLPRFHVPFPPTETSVCACGAVFVLSVTPLILAYYY